LRQELQEYRSSGVQEFRSSGVQEFRSSGVQGPSSADFPLVNGYVFILPRIIIADAAL
jgi:hypothetical protein